MPSSLVFQLVLRSILLPLAVGMIFRAISPRLADRLSPIASTIGGILLPLAALPILIKAWPIVTSFATSGSIAAIIAMVLIGLAIGHVFGGPDEENRTVLALATASRHPGIAIAVGHALFPDQRLVPVAVLLYLLVSALASLPYNIARKRRHHAPPGIPKPVGH